MKDKVKEKFLKIWRAIFVHPEDFEKSFMKWFDENKKLSFLTALIVGIITHITFLTEIIMSQDGLWNSMCYSEPGLWEISLGRWGIFLADKIVNNLAIPTVTGVAGILLIVFSTVLIVDLLKLKNKLTIFLVSAAMIVSPALTGTFLYIYTSVAYCLSMFLSVITVYLIFRNKNKILNWILALIIFILSLGIYQSYIGVVIGLTAIRLIRDLFDKEEKIKNFFIHGIVLVAIVIVGGLLYSAITGYILEKFELEESSYKGMDNISVSNTLNSLDTSIPKTYKDFYDFFFTDNIINNGNYHRDDFYKVLFVSIIISEIILIISSKVWKNPARMVFIIIMTAILPIAFNAILLLTTETTTYLLTAAQLILIIPFAAMIIELSGKHATFLFKWAGLASIFCIVFTYYLADNASYMTIKLKYNQVYSNAVRIMSRIETLEGYTEDTPIMIAGIISVDEFGEVSNISHYSLGAMIDYAVFHGSYSGMEGCWVKFMDIFFGHKLNFCNPTVYTNIANSIFFEEMDIFPAENSVKMIDNTIVVKLLENPPMP